VTKLGFHINRARPVLFLEFSFKRSVICGLEFSVPRVFFQKICGLRARIFCSESFLSKDLWFSGSNFLFWKFSFKRSVVFGLEFSVPIVFFQKICGFRAWRSGRPGSARHSWPISRPPWGVSGRVRHRRLTGPGPALFGAWEILGYGF